MDQLLDATARAEREHFWFRGFRRFVAPLLARAVAGRTEPAHPRLRLRNRQQPADAARITAGRLGIDLTFSGLAYAQRQGERLVAQASALSLPFPDDTFDLVTSFDVIYAFDDEMAATALKEMHRVLRPGGHLVLNVAALPMLRGNHSILGGEVQRYTRAGPAPSSRTGGIRGRSGSPIRTPRSFRMVAAVRFAQRLRQGQHELSDREMTVPAAPVNLTLAGLLALESVALRVVNMPLGSSLLTLARKVAGSNDRPDILEASHGAQEARRFRKVRYSIQAASCR